MDLVRIPAGTFTMGSKLSAEEMAKRFGSKSEFYTKRESPQHQVTISTPFYVSVTEVTQVQYEAIMRSNPSVYKGASNPVEGLSWNDAVEFCKKLSARTGQTVRLPTEAEWEYACRAGTTLAVPANEPAASANRAERALPPPKDIWDVVARELEAQGVPRKDVLEVAEEELRAAGELRTNRPRPVSVGASKPNAWGLYDMHGNVWEWCSDWYSNSYANAGSRDPQGPSSGHGRVLRGGSCLSAPRYRGATTRISLPPTDRSGFIGFRVVVEVK